MPIPYQIKLVGYCSAYSASALYKNIDVDGERRIITRLLLNNEPVPGIILMEKDWIWREIDVRRLTGFAPVPISGLMNYFKDWVYDHDLKVEDLKLT